MSRLAGVLLPPGGSQLLVIVGYPLGREAEALGQAHAKVGLPCVPRELCTSSPNPPKDWTHPSSMCAPSDLDT